MLPPSIFRVGHPVYRPGNKGLLGTITSVEREFCGFKNVDRAAVECPDKTTVYIKSDAIHEGGYVLGLTATPELSSTVPVRFGVKVDFSPPAKDDNGLNPFHVGQRIFRCDRAQYPYLCGIVKMVETSCSPGIYWATTFGGQVFSSFSLNKGDISIGAHSKY